MSTLFLVSHILQTVRSFVTTSWRLQISPMETSASITDRLLILTKFMESLKEDADMYAD